MTNTETAILFIATFLFALVLGVAAGAGTVEESVLDDCRALGGTRISETTIVCSVKP